MATLNPYRPPLFESRPIKWRPNPTCIHIEICFVGFLASLIVGNLLQKTDSTIRIVSATSIVLISFFLGWLARYLIPNEIQSSEQRIWASSVLVWMLLPFSAAMNAYATAVGVYDPKKHDSYPHSLTYWWTGLILVMLPATFAMIRYHYDIQTRSEIPSVKRYFVVSLVTQIPAWLVWSLAPRILG